MIKHTPTEWATHLFVRMMNGQTPNDRLTDGWSLTLSTRIFERAMKQAAVLARDAAADKIDCGYPCEHVEDGVCELLDTEGGCPHARANTIRELDVPFC